MHLDGRAGADRPLDADRRRLAELDVDAEVVRQRRLDDLLLHLAVQRDEDLLPDIVLPQVDQRVLLGELGERGVQRALVGGAAGNDDRLQRRRGEVVALRRSLRAAPIVSPIWMSPRPQSLPICPAADRRTLDGRAALEDADRGDLAPRSSAAEAAADPASAPFRRTSGRRRSSPRPDRARP